MYAGNCFRNFLCKFILVIFTKASLAGFQNAKLKRRRPNNCAAFDLYQVLINLINPLEMNTCKRNGENSAFKV